MIFHGTKLLREMKFSGRWLHVIMLIIFRVYLMCGRVLSQYSIPRGKGDWGRGMGGYLWEIKI